MHGHLGPQEKALEGWVLVSVRMLLARAEQIAPHEVEEREGGMREAQRAQSAQVETKEGKCAQDVDEAQMEDDHSVEAEEHVRERDALRVRLLEQARMPSVVSRSARLGAPRDRFLLLELAPELIVRVREVASHVILWLKPGDRGPVPKRLVDVVIHNAHVDAEV